jgi:DNA-binding LytR/AlgR family response regulator
MPLVNRIHRSVVITRARLSVVRRARGGGMRAILTTAVELPVGRKFRQSVHALICGDPIAE